jgi:MFS family permease
VGAVGAPIAITVDAISLAFAGVMVGRIRQPEPSPDPAAHAVPIRQAVLEGVRFVRRQPILRALAGEAGMFNMLWSGVQVAFLLFATGELGFSPTTLGLAFSVGSIGSLLGSLTIGRVEQRFGYGRAISLAMVVGTAPFLGLAAATPGLLGFLVVAGSLFVGSYGVGAAIVLVVTLRQTATPPALLGRAAATYRLLTYGVIPIGALLGGVLVDLVGARAAILVCATGIALAPIWIFRSPIPRLRSIRDARMSAEPDSPPSAVPSGAAVS